MNIIVNSLYTFSLINVKQTSDSLYFLLSSLNPNKVERNVKSILFFSRNEFFSLLFISLNPNKVLKSPFWFLSITYRSGLMMTSFGGWARSRPVDEPSAFTTSLLIPFCYELPSRKKRSVCDTIGEIPIAAK